MLEVPSKVLEEATEIKMCVVLENKVKMNLEELLKKMHGAATSHMVKPSSISLAMELREELESPGDVGVDVCLHDNGSFTLESHEFAVFFDGIDKQWDIRYF